MRTSFGSKLRPVALIFAALTLVGVSAGCDDVEEVQPAPSVPVTWTTKAAEPAKVPQPQSAQAQSTETELEATERAEAAAAESGAAAPGQSATVLYVTDGDTIRTVEGRVRIVGIDTPEKGECGFAEASAALEALFSRGDAVILEQPEGVDSEDHYGRLLRYVATEDGVDVGLMQIQAGNAVARYDSTDGYAHHPREEQYHAAQLAVLDSAGNVITKSCGAEIPSPAPAPQPDAPGEQWWTQYGSCTKLKKNTVGHPKGPFNRDNPGEADIYNWFVYGTGHNGDRDGDGLACE